MLPRALEVLLVALLVMLTLSVAFQFQNHAILRDILDEMRARPMGGVAATGGAQSGAPAASQMTPRPISPQANLNPMESVAQAAPGPAPAPTTPSAGSTPEPAEPASDGSSQPASPDSNDADPGVVVGRAAPATPAKPAAPVMANESEPKTTPEPSPKPEAAVAAAKPENTAESGPAAAAKPVESDEWEQFGPVVTRIVQELLSGEYEAIIDRFNPDMAATGLNRAQLAAAIDPIRKEHGGFAKILHHRPPDGQLPAGMTAFEVGVALEDKHQLLFTITLDSQQRIGGLLMK